MYAHRVPFTREGHTSAPTVAKKKKAAVKVESIVEPDATIDVDLLTTPAEEVTVEETTEESLDGND